MKVGRLAATNVPVDVQGLVEVGDGMAVFAGLPRSTGAEPRMVWFAVGNADAVNLLDRLAHRAVGQTITVMVPLVNIIGVDYDPKGAK